MSRQPRVAVVGAGLAGLTAGLELAKRGWRVDLYERSRLLGGKATSFEVEGQYQAYSSENFGTSDGLDVNEAVMAAARG